MATSLEIKAHIDSLNAHEVFTTRDMLKYGKRSAVDKTLSRLVDHGALIRLARGVFIKNIPEQRHVSAAEIAMVKAAAFGKTIMTHAHDCAIRIGFVFGPSSGRLFEISGHSSSFQSHLGRIVLHGVSHRKLILGDSPFGMLVRAIWYLRRLVMRFGISQTLVQILNSAGGVYAKNMARWIPGWLSDALCHSEAFAFT